MSVGKFLINNIEYVIVASSPLVFFGFLKLKKLKPRRNNLTSRYVKYKKQEDAINKRIKGGTIF